ncbi:hypothetical protein SPFM14_00159 [Salmonella phage SPFM14]|nr:hypothetical protein SPFM14_00159 [Salmonella phage SPFM14]
MDVPTFANFKDPKRNHTTFINDAYRRVWCSALGSAISAMAKSQNYRSLGITPSVGWEIKNYEFAIDRENNVLVVYAHPSEMWQELPEDIRRLVQVSNYNQDHAGRVPPLLTPAWDKEKLDWTLDEYARLKNLYSELMYFAYAVVGWNKLDALENSLELGGNVVNGLAKLMCDITRKQHHNFPPVVTAGYANGWSPLVQQLMDRHHAQTDHVTWAVLGEEWNGGNANFMEILCSVAIVERLLCKAPANEARHVRPAYFSMRMTKLVSFSAGLDSTWIMYQHGRPER